MKKSGTIFGCFKILAFIASTTRVAQNYFAHILHFVAKLFKLELNTSNPQINIKLGQFYQIAAMDSDLVQKWLDKLV